MAKQLNVNLAFRADTAQAAKELANLQTQLTQLMQTSATSTSGLGLTKDITSSIAKVGELKAALQGATTSTGSLDLGKFNQSLAQGKRSISDYADALASLGPQGKQAFMQLAQSVTTAEVPIRQSNKLLSEFATTLKNTARWQISSSILHGFIGSLQGAYRYAQDLNESLNNIRIVTGNNIEQMSQFAEQANKAAKALSTTTTAYTNAALIYYQQGDDALTVKEKTNVTTKMANVTGQDATVVSDQLTAIWNNFNKSGEESYEKYADILTALGAATASSTDEIAGGLEKFASIADMIGLSYEYAASALATITATTRQSEDVVGTALKTIFARIQGLSLGETLEDGTDLNKYSEALSKVGISIKDANGEMKDMDVVLKEMGAKWQTLGKDQQIALAQTVAGVRQYNQLVSLMDNWDFMEQNLATAAGSAGTLNEQADIYAESWEAARKRVTASAENIYDALLDDEAFIKMTNGVSKFLDIIGNTIDGLGGLKGVLPLVASLMMRAFGKDMVESMQRVAYNMKLTSEHGREGIREMRSKFNAELADMFNDETISGSAMTEVFKTTAHLQEQILAKTDELTARNTKLTETEAAQVQQILAVNKALGDEYINVARVREEEERVSKTLEAQARQRIAAKGGAAAGTQFKQSIAEAKEMQKQYSLSYAALQKIQAATKNVNKSNFKNIKQDIQQFLHAAEESGVVLDTKVRAAMERVAKAKSFKTIQNDVNVLENVIEGLGIEAYQTFEKIRQAAQDGGADMKTLNPILDELQASFSRTGELTEEQITLLKSFGIEANHAGELVSGMRGHANGAAQGLVTLGNIMSTTAMAFSSFKGLFDTWNNSDMSFGDKLLATFTTLGMVLPMVTTLFKKQTVEQLAGLSASILQAFGLGGLAAAETTTAIATGGLTAATASFGATLWTVLWPIGLVMLAIAALIGVIAGIVAIIGSLSDAYNADAIAAENAATAAKNLGEQYGECKSEYEDMISAMENYQSARDGLEELTKGTEEYKEALKDANRQALELINEHGLREGADYEWQGDELVIKDEAMTRVKAEKEAEVDRAYAASQMAGAEAKRLQGVADQTELRRSIKDDNGYGTGDMFWKGLGANLLGALVPGIGPIVSGAIMANQMSKSAEMDAAINKAVEASVNNPYLFESKEKMAEELDIDDKDLIDALWANKDSIEELSGEMNAAKEAEKLAAQNAANEIMSESGFANTEAGAMALEAGGEIYNQQYQAAYDKYLADAKDRGWFNTGTDDSKAAFNAYAKEAGLDQLKNFEVTNYKGDGTVEYKYIDENGDEQTKLATAEEIAATLAAADAANSLEQSLSGLRDKIAELNASDNAADHAMAEFISKGNLEGATKEEFDAISAQVGAGRDAEGNLTYDEKALDQALGLTGDKAADLATAQKYGYESAEAYRAAFVESLDVEWKVPARLSTDIADKLSLGAANKINKVYEEMGAEGGQSFLNALTMATDSVDWEGMSPEEQTAMMDEMANVDWSSWDAGDQAIAIVEKYGGAIDATSASWQQYISDMRDASNALPDLEKLRAKFAEIEGITKDIDLGSIISKDDFETLTEYNSALEDYFTILSDGSAMFTGDKLDFQQELKETKQKELKDAMAQYQDRLKEVDDQLKAGADAVGGDAENIDQYRDTENYKVIEKDANGKEVEKNYYKGKNVDTQLDFLESQNFDSEKIAAWRKDLEDGSTTVATLDEIAQAVNSTADEYNKLGEEAETMRGLIQNSMNEIALSAEDADERMQLLKEGTINEDAFNQAALAAHNAEKWEDIDVDAVEDYSKHLQKVAKNSKVVSKELENNAEAAEDVALYTMKMNKGIDKLADGFEDWSDILTNSSEESEEYLSAMEDMKDAMSDVLGVSEDFLSDDFILDNMEDIKLAAEGDAAAIDRLAIAAGKDILVNLDIQDQGVRDQVYALHDQLAAEIPDIKVGATVDDADFMAKAAQIVESAGMTVDQANAYFRSMGFEPNFEVKQEPVTRTLKGIETTTEVLEWGEAPGLLGGLQKYPKRMKQSSKEVDMGTVTEMMDVPALTTDGGKPNFTLTRTNSGAMNNYSSSNAGGGSPGGGGGGSDPKPNNESKKIFEEEVERYHEAERSIARTTAAIDRLAAAKERAFGANRLKALDKEIAAQKKLYHQYQDLTDEARAYADADKKAFMNQDSYTVEDSTGKEHSIDASAKGYLGMDVLLNEDGEISNYDELMQAAVDRYNAAVVEFEKHNDDDEAAKVAFEIEQAKYDRFVELMQRWEESETKYIESIAQAEEQLAKIQELNLEKITSKFENNFKVLERELKSLELTFDLLADDVYKAAEALEFGLIPQFDNIKSTLATTKEEVNELNAAFNETDPEKAISEADYYEMLDECADKIEDNIRALKNYDDQMREYYGNTLDMAMEEISKYVSQMEHLASVVEHLNAVLELTGESKDYKKMDTLLQASAKLAKDKYAASKASYEMLKGQKEDLEKDLLNAVDDNARKVIQDNLDRVIEQMNEAEDQMLSDAEAYAEKLNEILSNAMAKAADEMEKALSKGMGFEELNNSMGRLSSHQDEYLTKTNQIYEANKMMHTLQQDIDKTTNSASKQKLASFAKEIEALKESNQLSNLELEIAQAKYAMLQAQIALEEAQQSKSTVRLKRDAEGNYGYVYSADDTAVSDAQQQLMDAENDLYNIRLEATNDYGQKKLQAEQDFANALIAIDQKAQEDAIYRETQYQADRARIISEYTALIESYSNLYAVAQEEDSRVVADAWVNAYGTMISDGETWKTATTGYVSEIDTAFSTWETDMDFVRKEVGTDLDTLADRTKDLTDESEKLRDKIVDEVVPAMDSELTRVRELTTEYANNRTALLNLIEEYKNYLSLLNAKTNTAQVGFDKDTDYSALMNEYLNNGGKVGDATYNQLLAQRDAKIEWLKSDAGGNKTEEYWGTSGAATTALYQMLQAGGGTAEQQAWFTKDYMSNDKMIEAFDKINVALDEKIVASLTKVEENVGKVAEAVTGQVEATTTLSETNKEGLDGIAAKTETGLEGVTTKTEEGLTGVKDGMSEVNTTMGDGLDKNAMAIEENTGAMETSLGIVSDTNAMALDGVSGSLSSGLSMVASAVSSKYSMAAFDTGGYTGRWGESGKLAMLHEKELVLNATDTENILQSVQILRSLSAALDANARYASYTGNLTPSSVGSTDGTLQQEVHIEASFPGVTDHNEIELALDNLINSASQYANRK